MEEKHYVVTKTQVDNAMDVIAKSEEFCPSTKAGLIRTFRVIFPMSSSSSSRSSSSESDSFSRSSITYKPGDRINLSGPGIESVEQFLVSITGYGRDYYGIRFINVRTGRKAGNAYKPLKMFHLSEGLTRSEIEKHLEDKYKVH